jgi:hypothetical protein
VPRKGHTAEQILRVLREVENGAKVADVGRLRRKPRPEHIEDAA